MSPWVSLDDGMGEHRKIQRAFADSRTAVAMHFLGILHAGKYLTDGFIEDEFVLHLARIAPFRGTEKNNALRVLEQNGLWKRVEGGWQIHDYLDFNPSKTEVLARRERDAARKTRGRSARNPSGVRAESEGSPRVPSRPIPTTPLNPPSGGTNGRRRDREKRAEWIRSLAESLYPGTSEAARFAIGQGLGLGTLKTVGDLEAFIAERYPEVAKGAAA